MSFQPQPKPGLARARKETARFLHEMELEALNLEASGERATATHIRAVINATKNCADIRLKDC